MAYKNFKSFLHGCAGKTRHKSYLAAEYFLDNIHTDTGSEIYKCKNCNTFHIGTKPKFKNKTKTNISRKEKDEHQQHKLKHKKFKY
jgi:uncharacterized Zn finger protein